MADSEVLEAVTLLQKSSRQERFRKNEALVVDTKIESCCYSGLKQQKKMACFGCYFEKSSGYS